jgi:hypothetical protein
MERYWIIQKKLLDLERRHYPGARAVYFHPNHCISGGIQFAALDTYHKDTEGKLPVVCVVGINYTRDPTCRHCFFPFIGRGGGPRVESKTGSRSAVVDIIEAHNRNVGAWRRGIGRFQNKALASVRATDRLGNRGFILIMTNRCPFITAFDWQDQVRKTPALCSNALRRFPNTQYFDDLVHFLGSAVDLWIGHASIYGTGFVWPYFMTFVKRHSIQNWLLSPNISGRAHLYLRGTFRTSTHDLYPLFK